MPRVTSGVQPLAFHTAASAENQPGIKRGGCHAEPRVGGNQLRFGLSNIGPATQQIAGEAGLQFGRRRRHGLPYVQFGDEIIRLRAEQNGERALMGQQRGA
jgi:hypothetical protein